MKSSSLFSVSPVRLLGLLGAVLFFGDHFPLVVKQFAYSLSLSISGVLTTLLPFLIFSLIFSSIRNLQAKAAGLIFVLVCAILGSNFLAAWYAYLFSSGIQAVSSTQLFNFSKAVIGSEQISSLELIPLWKLSFPRWFSNDKALILGILAALFSSRFNTVWLSQGAAKLSRATDFILKKVFLPLIPVFICGFVLKFQHEGTLSQIAVQYGPVGAAIVFAEMLYLGGILLILSDGSFKKWAFYFKNIVPALLTGMSTMSSALALPLSIEAAQKNTGDDDLAGVVMPATVNFHLIGDAVFVPVLAFAMMGAFHMDRPDLGQYLIFSILFVLAKFSVAAVPAGGILVMLPILESNLGFTQEMLSLMTALYIVFDALITGCNVVGNGVLVIALKRLLSIKVRRIIPTPAAAVQSE